MIRRIARPPDTPACGKRVSATRLRAAVLLAVDVAVLLCAWLIAVLLASWTGRSWWAQECNPLLTLSGRLYMLMALLVLAGLATNGQYARRAEFWEETRVAWRYALMAALTHFALNFFLQVPNTRTLPVLAWLWVLALLPLGRLLAREALIALGCWWRAVLIVGAGDTAWEAAEAIGHERHLGLRIAGFVKEPLRGSARAGAPGSGMECTGCTSTAIPGGIASICNEADPPNPEWANRDGFAQRFPGAGGAPPSPQARHNQRPADAHGPVYEVPGGAQDAASSVELLARQLGCEAIVVVPSGAAPPALAALVARLYALQFEIFTAHTLRGLPVQGVKAQHFFSNDVLFLRLQHQLFSPLARIVKRGVDIVVSALLLLLLSPLMAWAVWRIWREDGAPVLYRQTRVGRGEADFALIKLRSMTRDADAVLETWKTGQPDLYARYQAGNNKLADDPRVLRNCRWMRRLSVDELPQLWNVLRGDMSLVGPRPLLRRELPRYPASALALYGQVRPGITGLWQVSGRSHTRFQDRADYDGWYVRNWSLWVDWVILLKTVRVVLSGRGAM